MLNLLPKLRTLFAVMPIALLACAEVRASLVVSALPVLSSGCVGDAACGDADNGAASSKDSGRKPTDPKTPQRELPEALFSSSSPVPGGASATPTSSLSFSTAVGLAIDFSTPVIPGDDRLVHWLRGEERLRLPSPPENELLRPPRWA